MVDDNLSERMNINRGVVLLIWSTHSHLCSALVEKRRVAGEGGGSGFDLLIGFIFYLFGASILRKLLLGFSQDKYLCTFFYGCSCLSFSDPIYMLLS